MRRTHHRIAPALALVLALTLVPQAAEAQTQVKSGFNMFTAQQDVEIGRESARQVEQQMSMVGGSAQSLVNDIGQRLARYAPGPDFNYRFRVVNAKDLNAFALPGGYVYINRGILEAADMEGEIAGVLAHEIAHVALRHGTHNVSKAQLTQAGAGILGGLLGGKVSRNTAEIINLAGGFGMNALFLRYNRTAERDADILGAQILARAGYSPGDMISFFQELEQHDHGIKVNWLRSHPTPSNRIARIRQEAQLMGVSSEPTSRRTRLASVQSDLRRRRG